MTTLCNICPRQCNTDRSEKTGFCGQDNTLRLARAALHFWEEPCISGKNGSGTVFFCGCNLKCVYCQNAEISRGNIGKEVSSKRLCEIFLKLQSDGAHNINLVTPTHYALKIKEALSLAKPNLKIPVVYNCGGYESLSTLDSLSEYIDIYLTDMKYFDNSLAEKYSRASDYKEVSFKALKKMTELVGKPVFDNDGMLKSGVIVRHMVLPTHRRDSLNLLDALKSEFGTESFILSLMSQYTPNGHLSKYPEINRKITSFEYRTVVEHALNLSFANAYTQELKSADSSYTPPFDLSGV